MGIFSDNVRLYYESGLTCVPCDNDKKKPSINEWQRYCTEPLNDALVDEWELRFAHNNKIGLTLGKANKLVAFDFDYGWNEKCKLSQEEFEKDYKLVERQILSLLPQTPCIKKGQKGWTRFYKWDASLDENSNRSCDRNGIRLFDFLSWHKQTIIPPSIHSYDQNFVPTLYVWQGTPIQDCKEDLPEISLSLIDDFVAAFKTAGKVEDNSRHGKLFKWIILSAKIQKDKNKIIEGLIRKDIEFNPGNLYLTDKKHHGSSDPKRNAEKWIDRVISWTEHKNGQKQLQRLQGDDQETFFEFFRQVLPKHKKEFLSKKVLVQEVIGDGRGGFKSEWKALDNKIKSIRSDAIEAKLSRTLVEDHLSKYKESLNPEFLFDIPKWDGVDRIDAICRLVPAKNYVKLDGTKEEYEASHAVYVEIIKDVASGIIRRAYNSSDQNLAPILRGAQNIGKDTFLTKVFGEPFGDQYWSYISISQDQQKNYDAVDGKLVCIIGEFDQAAKIQISHLKELITNSRYSARRAYDHAGDTYSLHHTIFSASNFDNVLRDTSGNRRFVIFDYDHINWEYSEHCDPDQLRAQFFHLYETGFRMSQATRQQVRHQTEEETPDDPINLAIDLYKKRITERFAMNNDKWLSNIQVTEIINDVVKITGVKNQWIRSKLKRIGLAKKTMAGAQFLNVSMHKE